MPERWIIIPRWDDFQHRDMARSSVPPWIKAYTRLLHDNDYMTLSLSQRGLLHGIWLLFASHRRVLSYDRASTLLATNSGEARHMASNIEALVRAGFIEISASRPASTVASNLASLEVEVEKKDLKASDLQPKAKTATKHACPECTLTFNTARELEHHLDHVHWIDPASNGKHTDLDPDRRRQAFADTHTEDTE
jgi:hypothetical protein